MDELYTQHFPDIKSVNEAEERGEITTAQAWELIGLLDRNSRSRRLSPPLTSPPSRDYAKLSELEQKMLSLLSSVSFGANSSARHFVLSQVNAKEMTPRQREYLRALVYKYRRQLGFKDAWAREQVNRMKASADEVKPTESSDEGSTV